MRDPWDTYFMDIAELVARRATCIRRSVGAIIVQDRQILATGYNGAPKGLTHCTQLGCMREKLKVRSGQRHELCRALHAEMNAIIQAAVYGPQIKDSTIYITICPCSLCTKMIINAGIKEVKYKGSYPDDFALQLIKESDVILTQWKK